VGGGAAVTGSRFCRRAAAGAFSAAGSSGSTPAGAVACYRETGHCWRLLSNMDKRHRIARFMRRLRDIGGRHFSTRAIRHTAAPYRATHACLVLHAARRAFPAAFGAFAFPSLSIALAFVAFAGDTAARRSAGACASIHIVATYCAFSFILSSITGAFGEVFLVLSVFALHLSSLRCMRWPRRRAAVARQQ